VQQSQHLKMPSTDSMAPHQLSTWIIGLQRRGEVKTDGNGALFSAAENNQPQSNPSQLRTQKYLKILHFYRPSAFHTSRLHVGTTESFMGRIQAATFTNVAPLAQRPGKQHLFRLRPIKGQTTGGTL
jgi:hypothetical protein